MIITSANNSQIKDIINLKQKSKIRKEKGLFVVEGIKMFVEIPKEDLVETYVSESFLQNNKEKLEGITFTTISDSVFKKVSDTVTPQGILAVVKQKQYSVDDILSARKDKSCIVVLDRLQDPGNMGTILRTGEGAGITGMIMSSECVDIYNPKVIRSTMGSVFRVPFAIVSDLPQAVEQLKNAGVTTYAAHLKGTVYSEQNFEDDCAFLIGNESKGLSDEVSEKADRLIKIPMAGKVESLNAAVATSILMYKHAHP